MGMARGILLQPFEKPKETLGTPKRDGMLILLLILLKADACQLRKTRLGKGRVAVRSPKGESQDCVREAVEASQAFFVL